MLQNLTQDHYVDPEGNPSGGISTSTGLVINWQNGPLNIDGERKEPNGCFVETLIAAAIGRLEFYEASKFNSEYNRQALIHLQCALDELEARTKDRESREVEGTHQL